MMSLAVISDISYYANLAKEDYYNSGGEPAGQWRGLGATMLGLHGNIERATYENIFNGFSPDGKDVLCEKHNDKHRPGWDLTMSPPKSVSVLWSRAEPNLRRQVQEAHNEAVLSSLKLLEDHAAITRRGHNGVIHEPVVGFVGALYEHSTSRSLDPQLHTHCLIANIAPRDDGTWGTIESRYLFKWQKAAGSIYRASLATNLQEIGIKLEHRNNYYEVVGIDDDLCKHFSKRSQDIHRELEKRGLTTSASRAGEKVKLFTRQKKTEINRPDLFQRWSKECDQQGFTQDSLNKLLTEPVITHVHPLTQTAIIDHLVDQYSVFRQQDLYQSIADLGVLNNQTLTDIEGHVRQLVDMGHIKEIGRDNSHNRIFSTKIIMEIEQKLLQNALQLNAVKHFQVARENIDEIIQNHNKESAYVISEEQQEAIHNVCQSSCDILQGSAGAGKSSSMSVVNDIYNQAGFKVIGATIAKRAADQLQDETGITSFTIAKLFNDLDHGRRPVNSKSVLIIDEAGLVGSKDLARLIDVVKKEKAKIILVGEDKQLQAISHAGVLPYLSESLGCSRIETIRRQREDWSRAAVMQLREGQADVALAEFNQRGLIEWGKDRDDTINRLVTKWDAYQQSNPDKSSLIVAQRWKEVIAISERVRTLRQAQGKVAKEEVLLDCFVSDKKIQFSFSVGDRIKFCKNDYSLSVSNGTLGEITNIELDQNEITWFHVLTDAGQNLRINTQEYTNEDGRCYFALAYALTVFSSQGCTVDGDTFVHYTTGMDRANTYVAGSRHRDACHWFCNHKEIESIHNYKRPDQTITDKSRLEILAESMNSLRPSHTSLSYTHAPDSDLWQELKDLALDSSLERVIHETECEVSAYG